jgi:hypothetical protein
MLQYFWAFHFLNTAILLLLWRWLNRMLAARNRAAQDQASLLAEQVEVKLAEIDAKIASIQRDAAVAAGHHGGGPS